MAKELTSFRLDGERIEWLNKAAAELETTKAALLEDALALAARTLSAADANFGSLIRAIAEQYGEDAQLLTWVDIEEDDRPVARVRVNGEEVLDLRGHVTLDHERGRAHVFLEFTGWSVVRYGSEYLGPKMMATLPLRAAVSLPWPPDPVHKAAAIATLGEIIHGGAQSATTADLAEQARRVMQEESGEA